MRLALLTAAAALFAVAAAPKSEARPFYEETGYGVGSSSETPRGAKRQRRYGSTHYEEVDLIGSWGSGRRVAEPSYGSYEPTRRRHRTTESRRYVASVGEYHRGVGPRPGRWCGWWMRTLKGGGPEFNVARNWRRWGSHSGPQVGAVVVWPHHVGIITGRTASGQWIVKSGNDGGRVRERARSVAGATFRVG